VVATGPLTANEAWLLFAPGERRLFQAGRRLHPPAAGAASHPAH
jgi:predicted glutamine amidotransferase